MKGLKKQLQKLRPVNSLECGPTNEEVDLSLAPDDLQLVEDDWTTFADEVSGKALSREGVFSARAEEIEFASRYNVWDLAPVEEAYAACPSGPIKTRGIDLNKGDVEHPVYRSRLVVQEIRNSSVEAIFAATPPLESVRMLLSTQRSGWETQAAVRLVAGRGWSTTWNLRKVEQSNVWVQRRCSLLGD